MTVRVWDRAVNRGHISGVERAAHGVWAFVHDVRADHDGFHILVAQEFLVLWKKM